MGLFGAARVGGADEGQVVAEAASYERAQQTVSALVAAEVPARSIAIVGHGLRSVERVTGRLGYAAAARSGAINGTLVGVLFAAILVIGDPEPTVQLLVGVLLVGVAIGMLFSLIVYAFVRRRRDYASVSHVSADRYEVTVASEHIATAREALGVGAVAVREPQSDSDTGAAPRYGERVRPPEQPDGNGARERP